MPHCQTFKQRIEELKGKAQNIEALLLEYVKTVDKKTEEQLEDELEKVKKEIEELRQEFKTKATQLIEEFIQRRTNKNEKVEIIFDERDCRFIIEGNLDFSSRTHLDDFPNLIKEITGYLIVKNAQTINLPNLEKIEGYFYTYNAQTINLPNLEKIGGDFSAPHAQTINLPNLEKIGGYFGAGNVQTINLPNIKEIRGDIYFIENNPNLNSPIEIAREWRKKGILKGKIYKITEVTKEWRYIEIP
jgi:hypothetical protein